MSDASNKNLKEKVLKKKHAELFGSKYVSRRDVLKYGFCAGLGMGVPGVFLTSGCTRKGDPKRPNIILITLDTTRVDRLSCYGYNRKTSPNLDKLAEESILYTRAIAPSSWTLPSHASLFTGKFTSTHGVRHDPKGPMRLGDAFKGADKMQQLRSRKLSGSEITLAEMLKNEGYITGGIVGGPWMKEIFGLNKGFDYYDDDQISSLNGRSARQITKRAVTWLNKVDNGAFFLFLNYFDPHWPYKAEGRFAKTFLPKTSMLDEQEILGVNKRIGKKELILKTVNALYDGEILFMDYCIGQLLQEIKRMGIYDNTWIIVTADHGELIGEHDKYGHGDYLYQEEIHVPLIIKYPLGEAKPISIDTRLQLIDILPMICRRIGMSAPPDIQGEMPGEIKHPIMAETYPLKSTEKQAVFYKNFKFIWYRNGNHLLFDLRNDPREMTNLASQNRKQVDKMITYLNDYLSGLPKPTNIEMSPEIDDKTTNALKSLGYLK